MKETIKRIEGLNNQLNDNLIILKQELEPYIEFDFDVQILPADGLVLLVLDTSNNVPMDIVIKRINRVGSFSAEYADKCIMSS